MRSRAVDIRLIVTGSVDRESRWGELSGPLMRLARTQQFRYLVVGGWNTLFTFALVTVLLLVFEDRLAYGWILLVWQVLAVAQAHLAQRTWVWKSREPFWVELGRFSLVYVALFFVNLAALTAGVEWLGWQVLPTQLAITAVLVIIGFLVNRHWTFSGSAPQSTSETSPPTPSGTRG